MTNKTYTEDEIKEVLALDEERTPGEWVWKDGAVLVSGAKGYEPIMDDGSAGGEYRKLLDGDSINGKFVVSSPKMAAIIRQLLARAEKAESELKGALYDLDSMHSAATEYAKKLEKAERALRFYHGGENEGYKEWHRRMGNDCGEVARKALSIDKGE